MDETKNERIKENILGTEKIGKLLKKFSIPCIISLLVSSLYNIVDQVFIGWGVGYLGNGATNIIFPLVVICMAIAFLIGDGSSSYLSIKLGEKKNEEAAKGVGNGIVMCIIAGIIFTVIVLIGLPNLVNLFGCTEALRPFALDYGYIIALGIPFMIIGTALNGVIRADGSPKYAMISMVGGAVLNVILDPIFIFVFSMGVKGAAIATIISQIFTFIINIIYIPRFKSINLNKDSFKLNYATSKKVCALGISSFITQMSIVIVIACENNLLVKYGAESKFGAEIPITVLGIVMKVNQILNSIILGIAAGAQPILGYNYGAGKYDRVKKAYKYVISLSLVISTIAFILFQTIPDKLILLFGSSTDSNYIEFACMAFRIYLMLCICNGFQLPSGIFFQAIGKSAKSAIISSTRQILFLVPSMIIFGKLFGIEGVLFAGPFSDILAFIISLTLVIIEMKNLGKIKINEKSLIDDTSTDNIFKENVVITISREYGSGGRYIGRIIADRLGIKFYDKDFITELAKRTGMSEEFIEKNEQRKDLIANFNSGFYNGLSNSDELYVEEANLVRELADRESCVIIGRCANLTLSDRENVFKVFISSDEESKMKRATEIFGLTKEQAKKEINRIDKLREAHCKHYTNKSWKDSDNYDLCINGDVLGVEKTAEFICDIVKEKFASKIAK